MDALDLIRAEQEHAREKGYTIERDAARNEPGALAAAGMGYLDKALGSITGYSIDEPPWNWPWDPNFWKPRDAQIENLVLAASLIVSEIDAMLVRLDMLSPPPPAG